MRLTPAEDNLSREDAVETVPRISSIDPLVIYDLLNSVHKQSQLTIWLLITFSFLILSIPSPKYSPKNIVDYG
mgnify:CR=1 FL=1